jgi:DMSO/TMAO reductase YedYZ molybdopterin-dependent catalytic subunit
MKKNIKVLIITVVVLLILIPLLLLYNTNKTTQLGEVEIRDYNGTRLDSVNSLRENSIIGVQYIDIDDYKLEINGLVNNPKEYSYENVISRKNYEKVVTLNCVEGWSATILWRGILLKELFDEVQPLDSAKVIIFHAYDNYTVTYPIDYFYGDKDILLAYEMNNATIIPARGYPFVLVAEDKWGYKWIKWITKIEFSDDTEYEGFWESKRYSKEGNLNESFFD